MGGSEGNTIKIMGKSVTIIKYFMCDHGLQFPPLSNRFALLTALSEEASYLLKKPLG